LLIEVAVAVRVIDDQMKRLPADSSERMEHERRSLAVKDYSFGMFDDLGLDLRKTCNKVIHLDVMEPHTTIGHELHTYDLAHIHEDDPPRSIDWKHLNGYVRLAGTDRGKEWYVLLDIEVFVQAVMEVLGPPAAERRALHGNQSDRGRRRLGEAATRARVWCSGRLCRRVFRDGPAPISLFGLLRVRPETS
jgi:hypothetical protein